MKDEDLQFDRTCHVLYSKPCKKQIRAKIALRYPAAEREAVWERVQRQYAGDRGDGEKSDPADLPQAAVCELQQAVLEEVDVQSVCAGEKRLR